MPKVVSNSSPLIHLSGTDRLDLLEQLFGDVLVPEAVYRECVTEGGERPGARDVAAADWIETRRIEKNDVVQSLSLELDEGEAEAIALAVETSADIVLLDDYEARRAARRLGLTVTGCLGVLLRGKTVGSIDSLRNEMNRLRETGFWLDEDLYNRLLTESGED